MSLYRLSCLEISSRVHAVELTRTRLQHALWLSGGLGSKLIRNIRRTLATLPQNAQSQTVNRTDVAEGSLARAKKRGRVRPDSFSDRIAEEHAWLVHSSIGITFCDTLGEKLRETNTSGSDTAAATAQAESGRAGGLTSRSPSETVRMLDSFRGPGEGRSTLAAALSSMPHQQREAVAEFSGFVDKLPSNWTLCAVTLTPQNKLVISVSQRAIRHSTNQCAHGSRPAIRAPHILRCPNSTHHSAPYSACTPTSGQ